MPIEQRKNQPPSAENQEAEETGEYSGLLGSYGIQTNKLRSLETRNPAGTRDAETQEKIDAIDRERHQIHLKLIELGMKSGKEKGDVLIDIIRGENTLEEYGLPEFSILVEDDIITTGDWHNPYYFNVDTKNRRPGTEPTEDWQKKEGKSLLKSEDVMLVFSISAIVDYGMKILHPEDYTRRVRRAKALANKIGGSIFNRPDTGYHEGSAEILGVTFPKKDFEKVCALIRDNPQEYRLAPDFYAEEDAALLKKINETFESFGSQTKLTKIPEYIEYTEELENKKVVMVDDDPDIMEAFIPDLIVATEGKAEFIPYEGQSAEELAGQIMKSNAEIVLMDYHLSDTLKGTQVTKILTNEHFTGSVVGFSSDRRSVESFGRAGALGVAQKDPDNRKSSLQHLSEIIERSKSSDREL